MSIVHLNCSHLQYSPHDLPVLDTINLLHRLSAYAQRDMILGAGWPQVIAPERK
jgi:hypothetical protein